MKAGYYPASIVDVSRTGMRLESASRLLQGTDIAIDFRGMIICGTVQYCGNLNDRYAMGIRIRDVLDPLQEEPAGSVVTGEARLEPVAALV